MIVHRSKLIKMLKQNEIRNIQDIIIQNYRDGYYKKIHLAKAMSNKDTLEDNFSQGIIEECDFFHKNMEGKIVGDLMLHADTTSQNVCMTLIGHKNYIIDYIAISDLFYIHKSLLIDAVTFYVQRKIVFNYKKRIAINDVLICSPFDIYENVFFETWSRLKELYPNITYLPISFLQIENNIVDDPLGNFNNYFSLIFKGGSPFTIYSLVGDLDFRMGIY